ncbi:MULTISPECIES: hypothetical protein [Robertmurraya]|uniref:Uncharacterized protein n=1 Tax=Robertmurraya beringensis TaxID=641660 RepID=A0ABV6KSV4_9BACI
MNRTFQLVQKVTGFVLLILIIFSLLMEKFSVSLIFCYIGISIYNGVRAFEYLNANQLKKALLYSILSIGFFLIFIFSL